MSSVCQLSPFGDYDTPSACSAESACGAKWRCATDATSVDGVIGEYDVYNVFVPLGSPLRQMDGTYSSPESVRCYSCGQFGEGCVPTTDGSNGVHDSDTCGTGCSYVCDDKGGKILYDAILHGDAVGSASPNCWTCNGSLEAADRCVPSGYLTSGLYSSVDECLEVSQPGCGWGYGVNPESFQCELRTDAVPGTSLEACKSTNPEQTGRGWGGCDQFSCRYGTCVGIPDEGENGPRSGEVVYASMAACESGAECGNGSGVDPLVVEEVVVEEEVVEEEVVKEVVVKEVVVKEVVVVEEEVVEEVVVKEVVVEEEVVEEDPSPPLPLSPTCIGDSCLFPDEFACDPLPGTWQLWRVSGSDAFYADPTYSATITPNAHITWKPPVVGVYQNWPNPDGVLVSRIPPRPGRGNLLFDAFSQEGFAAHERVWYDSNEMYIGPKTLNGIVYPAGYDMYPSISLGFRRMDATVVEVVILPAVYTNTYDATKDTPMIKEDGSPSVGGRGQGWAVMYLFAPEGECFTMPSIDFEAEFPGLIPMRLAPMSAPDSAVFQASACVFGTLQDDVCVCDEYAGGPSCEYTCGGHVTPSAPLSFDAAGYAVCS